jgi:hypothetical protein
MSNPGWNTMKCRAGRRNSSQIPSPDPYISRTLKPGNDIPPDMKPGDGMLHNDKPGSDVPPDLKHRWLHPTEYLPKQCCSNERPAPGVASERRPPPPRGGGAYSGDHISSYQYPINVLAGGWKVNLMFVAINRLVMMA